MSDFFNELGEDDVKLHDRYQFELKLDYSPSAKLLKNAYSVEFFFFIPQALGVDSTTYTKDDFYRDRMSLIRFKTPEISLKKLADLNFNKSPLSRIKRDLKKANSLFDEKKIEEELQLFGTIVRSQLRVRIRNIISNLKKQNEQVDFNQIENEVLDLCRDINQVKDVYNDLGKLFKKLEKKNNLSQVYKYIDEFFSITVEYVLTGLLKELRDYPYYVFSLSDEYLRDVIVSEFQYRKKRKYLTMFHESEEKMNENFVYRRGVLKKYILDVLLLNIDSKRIVESYRNFFGGLAAGIAMLLYLLLFIWQGQVFVVNSLPFVFITVGLYILKDRMKEGIKKFFSGNDSSIFPDYKIKIKKPLGSIPVGKLHEYFNFYESSKVPKEIYKQRVLGLENDIEQKGRPENIFVYRKHVYLSKKLMRLKHRRYKLHDIFRFNLKRILDKASDPYKDIYYLDINSNELRKARSSKIYHINMVIRMRYMRARKKQPFLIKKLRLIVDQNGIKRVEKLGNKV